MTPNINMKEKNRKYGSFPCSVCNKEFHYKVNLWRHEKVHSSEKQFKCTLCPYECKLKRYLIRHMFTHNGKKPYKCNECGKAFTSSHSLTSHTYIHTNEKPYQCSFCAYACRDSSTLRKHENRHSGIQTVFQCKMCPKSYKSKARLKMHVAEEHLRMDVKRHVCSICNGQYKTKATLAHHIKTVHDKSNGAQCELCGHHVTCRGNMRAHLLTHVDARPYKCEFKGCDKRFKDKSTAQRHLAAHKPSLACELCGRLFSRHQRLRRHLDTHKLRKKGVVCDYCGVAFYSKNYLVNHIQRKHGRKKQRYECDTCGLVTTNKPSIVMHLKYGHKADNERECKICHNVYKKLYLKTHYLKAHNKRYKRKKRNFQLQSIEIKQELPDLSDVEEAIVDVDLLDIEKEEFLGFPNPQETEGEPVVADSENIPAKLGGYPEKLCGSQFENIFSKHIEVKYEQKIRKRQKNVIRGEEDYANKHLERLLLQARRARKVAVLEALRLRYNQRIKLASNMKRDKITIKYFDHHSEEIVDRNVSRTDAMGKIDHMTPTDESSRHKDLTYDDKDVDNLAGDDDGKDTASDDSDIMNKGVNGKGDTKDDGAIDDADTKNDDVRENIATTKDDAVAKDGGDTKDDIGVAKDDGDTKNYIGVAKDDGDTKDDIGVAKDEGDTKDDDIVVVNDDGVAKDGGDTKDDIGVAKDGGDTKDDIGVVNDDGVAKDGGNTKDDISVPKDDGVAKDDGDAKDGIGVANNDGDAKDGIGVAKDGGTEKDDTDNGVAKENNIRNRKINLNTHQCYICFKLFSTKDALVYHCRDHFDICNEETLKKCPLCNHVTNSTITTHMAKVHDVRIKLPYAKIHDKKDNKDGSRYFYKIDSENIGNLEIIPSVKLLNKQAYMKIDRECRLKRERCIEKKRLVRRGKEWVVEKDKLAVGEEFMLSKVHEVDVNLKLSDSYLDGLKNLSLIAKKRGSKILFPCESCDKICQTLSALKLHSRKHETNPKPFRKKVWKHKIVDEKRKTGKNRKTDKNRNTVKHRKIVENLETVNNRKIVKNSNRLADPKPIVNKHRCDQELKDFYTQNIKGGDVEFWQFLKIFNKINRDGSDTLKLNNNVTEEKIEDTKRKDVKKIRKGKNKFTRSILLSKKEHLNRRIIQKQLRESISRREHELGI